MNTLYTFGSPNEFDLRSLLILGLSAKPAADAPSIGFFGTGLKRAIALLFNLPNAKCRIRTGFSSCTIDKTEGNFRGIEYGKLVLCNSHLNPSGAVIELPFTTNFSRGWEPWMIFRELIANTLDEGGDWNAVLPTDPNPLGDSFAFGSKHTTTVTISAETTITISADGLDDIYKEFQAKRFLSKADTNFPLVCSDEIANFPNGFTVYQLPYRDPRDGCVFVNGFFARSLLTDEKRKERNTACCINITGEITRQLPLQENRLLSSQFEYSFNLFRLLAASTNKQFIHDEIVEHKRSNERNLSVFFPQYEWGLPNLAYTTFSPEMLEEVKNNRSDTLILSTIFSGLVNLKSIETPDYTVCEISEESIYVNTILAEVITKYFPIAQIPTSANKFPEVRFYSQEPQIEKPIFARIEGKAETSENDWSNIKIYVKDTKGKELVRNYMDLPFNQDTYSFAQRQIRRDFAYFIRYLLSACCEVRGNETLEEQLFLL